MPQDRTPQLSFNLSRRLISIFLVSVLAVYTAGITVTLAPAPQRYAGLASRLHCPGCGFYRSAEH